MLKNIGGDGRIGSGKKMQVYMHDYGRSTHNKSKAWRSSMAPGTLIPCFCEIGLNGDTWEIGIDSIVRTLPTIGPLFGSYKMQVDFFVEDIRLLNAQLHNNALNVGRNIEKIQFPLIQLYGNPIENVDTDKDPNSTQINQSSILAYLGIRGLGCGENEGGFFRNMNAMPLLTYWDIYKNYYANKQEEIGVAISAEVRETLPAVYVEDLDTTAGSESWEWFNVMYGYGNDSETGIYPMIIDEDSSLAALEQKYGLKNDLIESTGGYLYRPASEFEFIYIKITDSKFESGQEFAENFKLTFAYKEDENIVRQELIYEAYTGIDYTTTKQDNGLYTHMLQCSNFNGFEGSDFNIVWIKTGESFVSYNNQNKSITYSAILPVDTDATVNIVESPTLENFDLENIDTMRELILKQDKASPLIIGSTDGTFMSPYNITQRYIDTGSGEPTYIKTLSNAGIGIKTYQSDRFNNWINTEWIDGENGINEITAIDTSEGSFTMDTLILQKKIYNMLNRIAMSGGSYNDWQDAVYGQQVAGKPESPVYVGGYSSEITFDEVVSNSATETEPLGTLGGRGSQKQGKNGYLRIKCDEPCIIMGIVSLTPRIDYSQGNSWMYKLETMNDLHKPALDGIGFQDLPTDEMAAWDTITDEDGNVTYKSAGKQPAYIEWQTSVNECYGNFADINNQMYMTLNRRYEAVEGEKSLTIGDVTTYIDPTKFNYAFAQTDLTAQNFWTHLGFDVKVRRIMSAKEMPNL